MRIGITVEELASDRGWFAADFGKDDGGGEDEGEDGGNHEGQENLDIVSDVVLGL